jgi:hypothetical protein
MGIRQRPLRVWCLQPPLGEAVWSADSLIGLELSVVVLMMCLDFLEELKTRDEEFFGEMGHATRHFA